LPPPLEPRDGDPLAALVERIQAGVDVERSFAELHRHCRPKLLRFFSRQGAQPAAGEDLTQETFVRVFQSIGSFERRSRFSAWLFEIALNVFRNDARFRGAAKREGFEQPLAEEVDAEAEAWTGSAPPLAATGLSPYEETLGRERREALREALETLPGQMRRCALLRFKQELKYREIGEVLGLSIDTVKAHLYQARTRLQGVLRAGELIDLAEDDPPDEEGDKRGPKRPKGVRS
jgi:RNA polymerase sigma-70 factor (ECF subfamily)